MKKKINLVVNGQSLELEVPVKKLLIDLIREDLGLTGTKVGCAEGECGACTVLVDGKAVCSCMLLAVEVDGSRIMTIEGLARGGKLHPLQEAFIEHGAAQCGFCTPGMILSAKALLDEKPHPDKDEIKAGLAGNFCRCTGYASILNAVCSVSEGSKND
jgi:aerobic-type carbon monoxide dehydrogenase small subunit (CoxS/CutS family)